MSSKLALFGNFFYIQIVNLKCWLGFIYFYGGHNNSFGAPLMNNNLE